MGIKPYHITDRQRLERLRDNAIDLQIELNDLEAEIATRIARVGIVLRLLRVTRAELEALERAA